MTTPSEPGQHRPTALDVARRAGVSRTTVSFVLNDRAEQRRISGATVQRVLAAADDLGYLPDRAARMLRSGRSDLVIFATPGPSPLSTLALHVVTALSDRLVQSGLHLLTRRTAPGQPFRDVWRELSPAAVVALEIAPADLSDLRAAGVPAVSFDVATFDDAFGAAQARHLLAAGHTALGYAAPPRGPLSGYADRRLAAVVRVCAEAGVPAPAVVSCALEVDSAAAAVRALTGRGATAVCAYNDQQAFAVLAGMAELGLRAPDDLAVIGADNDPLSALAVPALTTVDAGQALLAEHLHQRVIGAVEHRAEDAALPVPAPRVLVRRTA